MTCRRCVTSSALPGAASAERQHQHHRGQQPPSAAGGRHRAAAAGGTCSHSHTGQVVNTRIAGPEQRREERIQHQHAADADPAQQQRPSATRSAMVPHAAARRNSRLQARPLVASPPRFRGEVRHATLGRQPVDDVQRGAVPRPFRRRRARRASRGWSSCSPTSSRPPELRKRLDGEGLTQALFNMPPGDWAKGERGLASLPGRQAEFRDGGEAGAGLCRGAGLQAGALHGRDRAGRACRR